jgi:hypothetical protein
MSEARVRREDAAPPEPPKGSPEEKAERGSALAQLEDWLETPMMVLGFVWLALLVLELTRGLSPFLATLSSAIWIAFILDFALRFWLAPDKVAYLKRNWLGAISLVVPALRVLRVFSAARALSALRGVRLQPRQPVAGSRTSSRSPCSSSSRARRECTRSRTSSPAGAGSSTIRARSGGRRW